MAAFAAFVSQATPSPVSGGLTAVFFTIQDNKPRPAAAMQTKEGTYNERHVGKNKKGFLALALAVGMLGLAPAAEAVWRACVETDDGCTWTISCTVYRTAEMNDGDEISSFSYSVYYCT